MQAGFEGLNRKVAQAVSGQAAAFVLLGLTWIFLGKTRATEARSEAIPPVGSQ